MQRQRKSRTPQCAMPLFVIALAMASVGGLWWGWARLSARKPPNQQFAVTDVRRADLFPMVRAGGRVESGKKTIIECRLERFAVGVRGQAASAGGASVLLKLTPEGTRVKRGDVLAVLDSADYEELLRLQEMDVERARADKLQTELDHEIARLAMVEFRDGTMKEMTEDFQRRITLARSDLERAGSGQLVALDEGQGLRVRRDSQHRPVRGRAVRPGAPAGGGGVRGVPQVHGLPDAPRARRRHPGATANLEYQTLRFQRHLDRLATLKEQVKLCTVRAPHDGYLIYANDARREVFIEEGLPVRQNQKLFYLPDLADMQVIALLSESVVNQVRNGMRATVQVEGLPNHSMHGRVTKVAQLPLPDWRGDVHYFEGIVQLDDPPSSLMPGMTAQVEVEMPGRENVLAVRSEAVTIDDGHDVCFVVHEEGVERREVKLGQVTNEMTEVTAGLREGEQVVLNPDPEDIDQLGGQPTSTGASPVSARPASADDDVVSLQ